MSLNYYDDEEEDFIEEDELPPESKAALRRKNDWKYAKRRKEIANGFVNKENKRPLHYYTKNPPWDSYAYAPNKTNNKGSRRYISKNYAPQKNWNKHDINQIQNFENQINELFDLNENL